LLINCVLLAEHRHLQTLPDVNTHHFRRCYSLANSASIVRAGHNNLRQCKQRHKLAIIEIMDNIVLVENVYVSDYPKFVRLCLLSDVSLCELLPDTGTYEGQEVQHVETSASGITARHECCEYYSSFCYQDVIAKHSSKSLPWPGIVHDFFVTQMLCQLRERQPCETVRQICRLELDGPLSA